MNDQASKLRHIAGELRKLQSTRIGNAKERLANELEALASEPSPVVGEVSQPQTAGAPILDLARELTHEQESKMLVAFHDHADRTWGAGVSHLEEMEEAAYHFYPAYRRGFRAAAPAGMIPVAQVAALAKDYEHRMRDRFQEHGTTEYDTNASYYSGGAADEYQALDEEDEEFVSKLRALIAAQPATKGEKP